MKKTPVIGDSDRNDRISCPRENLRKTFDCAIGNHNGNIRIALNDETPVHRDNFLKLVSEGFYDGMLFHRVVKDFVIQAGDPDSKQAPGGKILGRRRAGIYVGPEIDLPFQYHKKERWPWRAKMTQTTRTV